MSKRAGELLDSQPGWAFAAQGSVKQTRDMALLAWVFGPPNADGTVDAKLTGVDLNVVEDGLIKKFWVIIDGPSDVQV